MTGLVSIFCHFLEETLQRHLWDFFWPTAVTWGSLGIQRFDPDKLWAVGAIGKGMSSPGLLRLTPDAELWEAPENSTLTSSWRISVC